MAVASPDPGALELPGAEVLGTTEVLGFIAFDFKDFLGSPYSIIDFLGFPRIYIRILSGF